STGGDEASAAFFTDEERAVLAALADVVIPPDDTPGGADLGAVTYIEKLLTAFDAPAGTTPPVFAGGPFSGRQPYGDGEGGASTSFPPNDFATFLPMDRVTEAAVRLFLYGSKGVPGGGPNDDVLGPVKGLRDIVRAGLSDAIASSPDEPLAALDLPARTALFKGFADDFQEAMIDLVCQAAWSAPEYGGNPDVAGWRLIHFEGDAQPLGYSLYDLRTGRYVERADAPMTTANPGSDPEPMDAATHDYIATVTTLAGGTVFR
ncbi:MAG TPA: gluconate 2-dehydrogenase subunit 3 family protein, partial [Minicystis sp.]|nr:gluconate 2-dehydrogenase subunit 3 family protein [Minicystis sp.]